MDKRSYFTSLSADERGELAEKCRVSLGHLRNVMYGKACAPALAASLEVATKRQLRRWDLRPDDWARVWPELTRAKGAPEPTKAEAT